MGWPTQLLDILSNCVRRKADEQITVGHCKGRPFYTQLHKPEALGSPGQSKSRTFQFLLPKREQRIHVTLQILGRTFYGYHNGPGWRQAKRMRGKIVDHNRPFQS